MSIDTPPPPSPSSFCRASSVADSNNANGCPGNVQGQRDLYNIRRILPSVLVANLLYALCYLPFFIYSTSSVLSKSLKRCNGSESSERNSSSDEHCSSVLLWYQASVTFVYSYVHHELNALAYVLAFGALRQNLLALLVALVPYPIERLMHTLRRRRGPSIGARGGTGGGAPPTGRTLMLYKKLQCRIENITRTITLLL